MNEHAHCYEFGPFSLDVGRRLLLRAGQPVPLAPKVLDTLLVLIENPGRVRGQLQARADLAEAGGFLEDADVAELSLEITEHLRGEIRRHGQH